MATLVEPTLNPAVAPRRKSRNLPLALMLLALGVYLLTMSGHTYSPDEETMLATSQALAANGSWALPPSRALVEVTGADGKRYSQYGPGQSLAALPWVVVGRLVGSLFPKNQSGFPLRLILASYNALIAAGICGLFAAVGLALGYARRATLIAAGGLAFSTFLWPHSRTFFAEPLAALYLLASFYLMLTSYLAPSWLGHWRPRGRLMLILSGVLFAVAVATKAQYAVALPAYVLYIAWTGFAPAEGRSLLKISAGQYWTRLLKPLLLWLAGVALGLMPLFLYNLAIFGGALTTGYGADLKGTFKTPLYEGAFGLLLSPGKGLLWYALPLVLAVWGFPRFARKHDGAAAAFVVALAVLLVVFFGLYILWPGDGSWGPRYLIPLLPFVMLPALPTVERATQAHTSWGRITILFVLALGFLINALGVLVNFDTYINVVTDESARYWNPDSSPILGHANLLGQRIGEWAARLAPPPGTILFKSGFSYSEGDKARNELLPRWTTGAGTLEVHPAGGDRPVAITLRLTDHRPPQLPRARVDIIENGLKAQVAGQPVTGQPVSADYTIPISENPARIVIQTDAWNPSKLQKGGRNEDLGVMLSSISVVQGDQPEHYNLVEALPAPPYYPQPRWYYDPGTHHLADLWPAYMAETGMGRKAMLALGLPVAIVGLVCLAFGWVGLRNDLSKLGLSLQE